jgi:hypothetical protein
MADPSNQLERPDVLTKEYVLSRLIQVSGPNKNVKINNRIDGKVDIYGSYHFEEFTHLNCLRNVQTRFDEFQVPHDLTGKVVVDIGASIGSLSFECLRRGAEKVFAFEFVPERIEVMNLLAEFLGLSDRFVATRIDLNDHNAFDLIHGVTRKHPNNIVFACSIDLYINDRKTFYSNVAELANETCFFEINSRQPTADIVKALTDSGFIYARDLPHSKTDGGIGRIPIVLDKRDILSRRYMGNEFDHVTYRYFTNIITEFENEERWETIKRIYEEKLEDNKYVIDMDFDRPLTIITPYIADTLSEAIADPEIDNEMLKQQVIECMQLLGEAHVAHRDIYVDNVLFDKEDGIIKIIDWEYVTDDPQDYPNNYDIAGTGLESPLETENCCIFHKYSQRGLCYFLNIEKSDFGL